MDETTKTSYRLEMNRSQELRAVSREIEGLHIERMEIPCPELNKFFHTMVGYDYRWGGRTDWGRTEWYEYANRDELETWIARLNGTPAGYFEIEKHPTGEKEIKCFGLLPQFIGRGLGGVVLTRAIQRGWEISDTLLFLRTCSLDHPHALSNYLARGFHIAEQKTTPANKPIKSFWEMVEGSV